MNEELLKKAIRFKLELADSMLDCLPPKMSSEIRSLRRTAAECLNDYEKETHSPASPKESPDGGLKHVPIE